MKMKTGNKNSKESACREEERKRAMPNADASAVQCSAVSCVLCCDL